MNLKYATEARNCTNEIFLPSHGAVFTRNYPPKINIKNRNVNIKGHRCAAASEKFPHKKKIHIMNYASKTIWIHVHNTHTHTRTAQACTQARSSNDSNKNFISFQLAACHCLKKRRICLCMNPHQRNTEWVWYNCSTVCGRVCVCVHLLYNIWDLKRYNRSRHGAPHRRISLLLAFRCCGWGGDDSNANDNGQSERLIDHPM